MQRNSIRAGKYLRLSLACDYVRVCKRGYTTIFDLAFCMCVCMCVCLDTKTMDNPMRDCGSLDSSAMHLNK